MRTSWRRTLHALGCALALACASGAPPAGLSGPGVHVLILPVEDLPGEDSISTPAAVQPGRVQTPDAVKRYVERELLACLGADDRTVVGPNAVRQIRARMREEIAAARGGDPAALSDSTEATVTRYALREFLDDHPGVNTIVRPTWRKVNAAAGVFEATWDGTSYPVPGPEYGALDRLWRGRQGGFPLDALSLHLSIETRSGARRSAVQSGIGLLASLDYGADQILLQHGEVYTDPSAIRGSIRQALGSLCGEDLAEEAQ